MENLQQRILKGVKILKDKNLLFITICLTSSIISIFAVPFFINSSFSEQEINEGIAQVGERYVGALAFSAKEMIAAIILLFQSFVFLVTLIIITYIIKRMIDKEMFRMNKWRDWKFFIYLSGISLIIVNVFQKIIFSSGNSFITNLLLIMISSAIITIFSTIFLPEELPEIEIQ